MAGRGVVPGKVAEATKALEELVVSKFKASFASEKNAHAGSTAEVAQELAAQLGGGAAGTACENLGVDYSVGEAR